MNTSPRPQKRPRRDSTPTSPAPAPTAAYSHIPAPHLLLALPSLVLHPPTHRHHLQSIHTAQHALRRCLQLNLDRDLECRAWTALAELGLLCLAGAQLHEAESARWRGELESEVERALTKALPISQKHPALRPYYPHLTLLSARLSHIQRNPRFAHHTLRRLLSSFLGANPHAPDPPHVVYAAHLALVHSLAADALSSSASASAPGTGTGGTILSPSRANPALQRALGAIQDLHSLATSRRAQAPAPADGDGHAQIALLARYLALHTLVRHGAWARVGPALEAAEAEALGYTTTSTTTATTASTGSEPTTSTTTTATAGKENGQGLRLQLEIQILVLGVVYHTYAGAAGAASERLSKLHGILDSVGVGARQDGGASAGAVGEVHFREDPRPLHVAHTHPAVLHALAFLLSAAAKRDAAGRRPKKGVFAREGLGVLGRGGWGAGAPAAASAPGPASASASGGGVSLESAPASAEGGGGGGEGRVSAKEIPVPVYASLADVREVEVRMMRIKADLLGEVVGLAIMRSEFDEAEVTLNTLIAHTRTHALFPAYAARITLQQAQLAHALARPGRALQCYRVAEWLAGGGGTGGDGRGAGGTGDGGADEWVRVAARAGQVWVRIGRVRLRARERGAGAAEAGPLGERGANAPAVDTDLDADTDAGELEELRRLGGVVAGECAGMGGALRAVGEVIRACLVEEYLGAKTHLRRALDAATAAQDNHLRALVLALVAAQYLHTAREHAETMLGTCEQLGAGLGASAKPDSGAAGQDTPTRKGNGNGNGNGRGGAGDGVGNAQLRLWVGERFLELHRWSGDAEKAQRQVRVNERFRRAVGAVEARRVYGG